jgi:heme/copper-type cytochrome/quinol oxidase subunit 1
MADPEVSAGHDAGTPPAWRRWLDPVHPQDSSTRCLIFAGVAFLTGGAMVFAVRLASLWRLPPADLLLCSGLANTLVHLHFPVMVMGAVSAWLGLASGRLTRQTGAQRAFPRVDGSSFWMLMAAFILLLSAPFAASMAPAVDWSQYLQHPHRSGPADAMRFGALLLMALCGTFGALRAVVSILSLRDPGGGVLRMPLAAWAWLITGCVLIATLPMLAAAQTLLLADHFLGTGGPEAC